MDYEKKYNEALERAKNIKSKILQSHLSTESCKAVSEYIDEIIPELCESEDEKIRKKCIELIKRVIPSGDSWSQESKEILDCIAYLEKQKEKKFDFELIKQAWYMEGYKDREFGKESKWIIKTGDDGPKYEENPKYGQMLARKKPATFNEPNNSDEYEAVEIGNATCLRRKEQKPIEKQDYSGLNDLERAILRGFLSAGVENVPVTIIKETAQEYLTQQKAEWSEKEEKILDSLIRLYSKEYSSYVWPWANGAFTYGDVVNFLKSLRPQPKVEWSEEEIGHIYTLASYIKSKGYEDDGEFLEGVANKLKSLRPSWKPSEEQMDALKELIDDAHRAGWVTPGATDLYEQLKKL